MGDRISPRERGCSKVGDQRTSSIAAEALPSSPWLGEHSLQLDEKNRLFLSRKLQAGLDRDSEGRSSAVLTRGFENCLFLFSESGFARLLASMPLDLRVGAKARAMQRLFFASSHRSTLDTAGRLLIPEKLKEQAQIDRDVVVLGLVDRIEIWSESAWRRFEKEASGDFDQLDFVLSAQGPPSVASPPA